MLIAIMLYEWVEIDTELLHKWVFLGYFLFLDVYIMGNLWVVLQNILFF